ncbi:MAG: MATE family efflux transporter [Gammaproteobacteria bacterium]|nr:MATE family efflux transporter [Gammaproteobacteria bacterium]MCP5199613.1 MATE family efflux transporter [Gammaproteobacteria bacterium]
MLDRQRFHRILGLALPIVGGMVSQNVLNLVDTAMVSRLEHSDAALAAVGYGGFALFVTQAVILGLSTGVQASAARRKGQGRLHETGYFLNAALLVVVCIAPLLSLLLIEVVPHVFPYINNDPAVVELGVPYLQVRAAGIVFVASNFAFRGYWNAIDLTRVYMFTLVSMHTLNIVLDYALIFGHFGAPALGVQGAAVASVTAFGFGTTLYCLLGLRYAREYGFLRGLPGRADVARLVRLSLPSGIQQMFFAAGFLTTFWIIGQVGTAEIAGANVLINVMLTAFLPGMGLGLAAATLVGQALGRGDADDAARWGWDVVKVAMVAMGLLGLPMVLCPRLLLGAIYTLNPETLELTLWPLRMVGLSMLFEAVGTILQSALLGAGDTRRVMLVAIVHQWLLFLPLAYLAGPVHGYGLTVIWGLQVGYRALQAAIFATFWLRRRWARIEI